MYIHMHMHMGCVPYLAHRLVGGTSTTRAFVRGGEGYKLLSAPEFFFGFCCFFFLGLLG